MSKAIRDPATLDETALWGDSNVKQRLQELTSFFISKLANEEMQSIVDKAKRAFETPPLYNYHSSELEAKFGDQARKDAENILEQERKGFVDFMTPFIKTTLESIIPRLRFMVYAVDEKGEPYKLKLVLEETLRDHPIFGTEKAQVMYVGDHDFERYYQIGRETSRLMQFQNYVPYFSEDLAKLWKTAQDLSNFEILDLTKPQPEATTQKNMETPTPTDIPELKPLFESSETQQKKRGKKTNA